ncbi:MAG: hypothetical protein EOP61_35995 [Sphingomonadales bacterium]|nr:MAG: hypothetical protein EOP61_35995 [Sphingomonadales bacterium]
MANIRVHPPESSNFETLRSMVPEAEQPKYGQTELDSTLWFIEPGDKESLQLFEVDYLPDADIAVHAHDEDEIIYILGGEMRLGNRVLKPGGSIFIAGNTLYSFKAGPEGLRMLNFRPRRDNSFIRPEDHKRR